MAQPKRMNFWKSSKRGGEGGSFPIQKFMLQIFAIINASSVMNSGKKAQHDFPKMRGEGGSKAVWNFSKNSSVLEMSSSPKEEVYMHLSLVRFPNHYL